MTREDAIEWLTNEKWTNANNKYKREWNEVFDMAIEALSAPQTDLISRADAIEAVANMLYEEPPYLNTEVKCYKYAEKLISALPSAEAVDVVRCKDCRWYRDTFFDTKITPICDRHIDDRYGTLVGGITESSFCSYGERKEP